MAKSYYPVWIDYKYLAFSINCNIIVIQLLLLIQLIQVV